jgi:hypothetical protein
MQKVLLVVALLALFGVGGAIFWDAFQKANLPPPAPYVPPPPVSPDEIRAREAAKKYEELNAEIAKNSQSGELYAKRGKAIFDAKGAIKLELPKLAEMAIKDLIQAESLGYTQPDVYAGLVSAALWIDALNPATFDEEGKLQPSKVRELWFARTIELLDKACDKGAPAHQARIDFIEFRFRKAPPPPDPGAWHEKQLASYEALMQAGTATAADCEKAGDVAKETGKLNRATAFYLKAIDLAPEAKERLQKKMSGR